MTPIGSDILNKRKRIGVIVANPETTYPYRVLEGITKQCQRYDYDCLIFPCLKDVWFSYREYLKAELNIFNLMNTELVDAVVVVAISLTRNTDTSLLDELADRLRKKCTKPIVYVDYPYPIEGSYSVITDDAPAFRKITSHVLDVHGVRAEDIYFLAAMEGLDISENRILGFRQELEARGLPFDPSHVFHGDFWYGSGDRLAERIVSGELKMPRAVICANDHMAIGLTKRLAKEGIKVPEQIIAIGYDATQDAVLSDTPITSFEPNVVGAAEEAVNIIRKLIDPDEPVIPSDKLTDENMCIGLSCGCQADLDYLRSKFKTTLYKSVHDYTKGFFADSTDMATIVESYMLERMTVAQSPDECLAAVANLTYLLDPFRHFYLCLRPDWLNTYKMHGDGYPTTMREVIHATLQDEELDGIPLFSSEDSNRDFPTEQMLPQLELPRSEPAVFYFAPIHFQGDTLGYCVLQCDLNTEVKTTAVFRNWIRNVNNGLEIVRVQNRLLSYSLYDSLTGLYNRRGMDRSFAQLCRTASEDDSCLVYVIDMNWLKKINDNFGHPEGDYAIRLLARCVAGLAADEHSFAVRAGGDEFYVIAMGKYDEEYMNAGRDKLLDSVNKSNAASGKTYTVSVSVGCCLRPYTKGIKLEELVHEADVNMYQHKRLIKQRESFG